MAKEAVITLLDRDFNTIAVIDSFESFIWTDRYMEAGDFEFYSKASKELLELFQVDYYLANDQSEHLMIIEGIETTSDVEDGDHIKVTGRSLESILERRIIWNQTVYTGRVCHCIRTLIQNEVISPSISTRRIPNFTWENNYADEIIKPTIDSQYTGNNLYTVVTDLCKSNKFGLKVTLNENKQFVCKLYVGTDRSDEQKDNIPVIFSSNFDNIINSDFKHTTEGMCNIALVAGEGEGKARKTSVYGDGSQDPLLRRELFVDARDISSNSENPISPADYIKQLDQRGKEKLAEKEEIRNFEGEVVTDGLFKYGIDFFLGDHVHFYDQYGNGSRVRIDEMIFNWTESGYSAYPTFTVEMNEKKEETS